MQATLLPHQRDTEALSPYLLLTPGASFRLDHFPINLRCKIWHNSYQIHVPTWGRRHGRKYFRLGSYRRRSRDGIWRRAYISRLLEWLPITTIRSHCSCQGSLRYTLCFLLDVMKQPTETDDQEEENKFRLAMRNVQAEFPSKRLAPEIALWQWMIAMKAAEIPTKGDVITEQGEHSFQHIRIHQKLPKFKFPTK